MTGSEMAMTTDLPSGEARYRARRRAAWTTLGVLAGLGFVTGLLTGFFEDELLAPGRTVPPALAWAGVLALAAAVIAGSWRYFRQVDELELADNLWACLYAVYVYSVLFPAWWALEKLGAVSEPQDWTIYIATIGTMTAAYGWRKLRHR